MKQGERFGFNYVPPTYPLHIGGDGITDSAFLATIVLVDSITFSDSGIYVAQVFEIAESIAFRDGGTI